MGDPKEHARLERRLCAAVLLNFDPVYGQIELRDEKALREAASDLYCYCDPYRSEYMQVEHTWVERALRAEARVAELEKQIAASSTA